MDDETRFWIAQEVADTKFTHSARSLFKQGKELMGKKPSLLITDGLPAYRNAFDKKYFPLKNPRPKHQYTIRISGDMNNNKMERFNGEVRDREKVMRGLKKKETLILKGYQIFHNYIREHQELNDITPAEACGINVMGKNKRLTIIQNASKQSR
jgi:putative transposase